MGDGLEIVCYQPSAWDRLKDMVLAAFALILQIVIIGGFVLL